MNQIQPAADETENQRLFRALDEQGFSVSERPHGKRWQYFKEIEKGKHVVVEFHAPLPEGDNETERAWNRIVSP